MAEDRRKQAQDKIDAELDRLRQNHELLERDDCPKCGAILNVEVLRRGRDAGEVTVRCSDWMKCDFRKVLLPAKDFHPADSSVDNTN